MLDRINGSSRSRCLFFAVQWLYLYRVPKKRFAMMKKRPSSKVGQRRVRNAKVKKQLTLHLIDALPYVFRAYYSLPSSIKDPSGRQSNAVVGFANFIVNYIRDEKPTHVALCFDRSLTSSFRNKIYPAYKSNRGLPPPELKEQIGRCRKLSEALGVACFDDKLYEADDLIATLGTSATAAGHRCVVVTSDKDLCQLVGPALTVYDFAKGERHDAAGVIKKMGVHPHQVPDLLGLMGDAVDCIPGVKGIGSKTAVELLKRFKNLEHLYASLPRVAKLPFRGAQGIQEKLAAEKDKAFLSRDLATVARKVRIKGGSVSGLKLRRVVKARVHPLLDNFGLRRFHDRVDAIS